MLQEDKRVQEITLTLNGVGMEDGAIDCKTLVDILKGSVGAIQGFLDITKFEYKVTYKVRPPKEKCFEISLQAVQWAGALAPMITDIKTIQDMVGIFIEYLKIKKGLAGEALQTENIQKNENGDVIIKNNKGSVIYIDNRKIVNQNIIAKAAASTKINENVDEIAKALAEDAQVDEMTFSDPIYEGELFSIAKEETPFFRFQRQTIESEDTVKGYIRKIDNKTHNGSFTLTKAVNDRAINFRIDILGDLNRAMVVRELALAEAEGDLVTFVGKKVLAEDGTMKRFIVTQIIPEKTPKLPLE